MPLPGERGVYAQQDLSSLRRSMQQPAEAALGSSASTTREISTA